VVFQVRPNSRSGDTTPGKDGLYQGCALNYAPLAEPNRTAGVWNGRRAIVLSTPGFQENRNHRPS
jgi:hypothetical protein